MIGDARRVHPKCSQLVAPGDGGSLILERTDRLPPVKARITNRHQGVFGATAQEAKTTHAQRVPGRPGLLLQVRRTSINEVTGSIRLAQSGWSLEAQRRRAYAAWELEPRNVPGRGSDNFK
jgi:hypothetical protein